MKDDADLNTKVILVFIRIVAIYFAIAFYLNAF